MFVELQFLVSLRVEKNKELGREELIQIGYGLEFTKIVLEEMGVFDDNLDRTKRFCK
jgi:outer membrane cobalamin receptor